jgi:hypothetical protein
LENSPLGCNGIFDDFWAIFGLITHFLRLAQKYSPRAANGLTVLQNMMKDFCGWIDREIDQVSRQKNSSTPNFQPRDGFQLERLDVEKLYARKY